MMGEANDGIPFWFWALLCFTIIVVVAGITIGEVMRVIYTCPVP